jgi:hypothetical protein
MYSRKSSLLTSDASDVLLSIVCGAFGLDLVGWLSREVVPGILAGMSGCVLSGARAQNQVDRKVLGLLNPNCHPDKQD